MATTVVQGRADTAQDCITAMNVATTALTITNVYAQGVVKVGSNEWRYYFIYN